ncbi:MULTISPECIES: hypothetical protein [unclassified Chelatococcus]|nr:MULTISPECIES: hypothetical protein [unclassified Chelatococcus]MBS7695683.1 hypothetical protein [Chelatococcus sp. YT9]MBX3557924.1 hypothetical protein [Chelatococcus sp.]
MERSFLGRDFYRCGCTIATSGRRFTAATLIKVDDIGTIAAEGQGRM